MSPVAEGKLRLGGMALRNGLLVHGPTHWAAAVRDDDGEIRTASGRKPRVRAVDGVPGVRGVVRLGEAFAVIPLVKRALPAGQAAVRAPERARRRRRRLARRRAAAPARARPGRRGGRRDAVARARRARAARRRAGRVPRRRAQGDRRVRVPTRTPTRPTPPRSTTAAARTSSTPLLASNLAGALLLRRVLEQPGPGGRRRRGASPRPRPRSRSSPGASATRARRWRARCAARASSCSACSARASRTSASSRSAAPRSRRSCASKAPPSDQGPDPSPVRRPWHPGCSDRSADAPRAGYAEPVRSWQAGHGCRPGPDRGLASCTWAPILFMALHLSSSCGGR